MTPEQEYTQDIEEFLYQRYEQGLLAKEDIEDMGISFDKLLEKFR